MKLSNDERELFALIREHPELISHAIALITAAISKHVHPDSKAEKPPKD